MKHRVLDFLVCPECHGNFSIDVFAKQRQNHTVDRKTYCKHQCSFCNKKPSGVECSECFRTEILEGLLTCIKCGRQYPVIGGIPRTLPDSLMKDVVQKNPDFFKKYADKISRIGSFGKPLPEEEFKRKTASSFGFQWNVFSKMIDEFRNNFLKYIEPIKPEFFRGKLVLDAGCGFGRHTYYAAEFGAEAVGFDLSDAVEAAYRNTRNFPHAHNDIVNQVG